MGDENFCLFSGKLCETVFDGVETFLQDVELFVAFISVVAVVVWGQSKAKYEMVFIFKFDIIEQIYIRNVGDEIRESAGFGKNTAMFGVVAEIVVVAEADADRSDGTEMFDIDEVCSKIPDDYAIIVKHHPFVQDVQPIPEKYADRVIDLSEDNELNDLLFVTDVIITDYSSLVFEASLIDIPMIFYVFDLEKYINERDFYFDFKLYAPGKIVYSTEQLIDAINKEDYCTDRIKPFADMFFDYRDGKSTDRVVDLIYDNLKK